SITRALDIGVVSDRHDGQKATCMGSLDVLRTGGYHNSWVFNHMRRLSHVERSD
ncbi:hypothetical protein Dimus_008075, partial [Dionaea muscipula]